MGDTTRTPVCGEGRRRRRPLPSTTPSPLPHALSSAALLLLLSGGAVQAHGVGQRRALLNAFDPSALQVRTRGLAWQAWACRTLPTPRFESARSPSGRIHPRLVLVTVGTGARGACDGHAGDPKGIRYASGLLFQKPRSSCVTNVAPPTYQESACTST